MNDILKFYSRKDIQKELVRISKDREVTVKFNDSYGKRPDILQFENDILELAKQGATSFHFSEEHWKNPLSLKAGMSKKQLDDLRIGWDLILDLDTSYFEYAKIAAFLIIDALKFHDVENISVKYSGNRGLHIAIPFKSFPNKVNNVETKLLFPEGPRVIASYLKEIIKGHLSNKILELNSIKEISEIAKKPINELKKENKFNPFSVVDIDTILISNRHMFRSPYSYHELTGLISIPIKQNEILKFNKEDANIKNIKTDVKFLDKEIELDAKQLIMQAFDWQLKQDKKIIVVREFITPDQAIPLECFPECITLGLQGLRDGKKRFLFVLLAFLKSVGWSMQEIENLVYDWNKRNYEPLKENYVRSQLNWHKRQTQKILPPNCDNKNYYDYVPIKGDKPVDLCKDIKNPVNYAVKMFRRFKGKNLTPKTL